MGLGSVIGGLINSGRSLPTVDLSALFATIDKAGADKEKMINNLPEDLKPLYEQYKASNTEAGTALQTATTGIGQKLLEDTKGLYDPNSAAVQATLAALKQQDYSTLPGTIANLKGNLAGMGGGLSTGGAAKAVTQAVMAPAAAYSQQAANTEAQQLNLQQTNVQNALNKIAAMDDATANSIFGMSVQQAQTILTSGRQDLQNQLSELINNVDTKTNQTLGLQGLQAQNAYQNALTRNAQQSAIVNGLANDLLPSPEKVLGLWNQFIGGPGAAPESTMDVSSPGYQTNSQIVNPNNRGGGNGGGAAGAASLISMLA